MVKQVATNFYHNKLDKKCGGNKYSYQTKPDKPGSEASQLPGIMNADDALQYFLAGASAIQIGTANFVNPQSIPSILEGVQSYCTQEGVKSISHLHTMIH